MYIVAQIKDWNDQNNTQYFGYDNLNRISSFSNRAGSMRQNYSYDTFGNLSQSGTLSSVLTFDANNRITSGGVSYDAEGNITQTSVAGVVTNYSFDAEGRVFNVNSGSAYYTYDSNGERMRKDVGGTYTEYQFVNGQPIAERHSDGSWSDYIFANGQRIAKSDTTQSIDVRFTNDSCSGCSGPPVGGGDRNLYINSITVGATTIQQSDPSVSLIGAPCNVYSGGQAILACNGDVVDSHTPTGDPITINALGSPDYNIYPHMQVYVNGELAGEWDVTGQAQNYTVYATHFYTADHLGTASQITNSQGAIANDCAYYPFGTANCSNLAASDHYLYAGLERDSETGLDHAMFRQYSPIQGRWFSPDPYHGSYDFSNPQSFNRYAYVGNNPLGATDPSGLKADNVFENGDGGCTPDFDFCDDPCDLWYDCGVPTGPPEGNPGIAGPTITPPVKDPYNGPLWTDHGGFQPTPYSDITAGLSDLLHLPAQGCEFGCCGPLGPLGLTSGVGSSSSGSMLLSVVNSAALFFGPLFQQLQQCQVGNCKYKIYYGSAPVYGNYCSGNHKTDGSSADPYSLWDCLGDLAACKASGQLFQNSCRAQGQVPLECSQGLTVQNGQFYVCPCCYFGKNP